LVRYFPKKWSLTANLIEPQESMKLFGDMGHGSGFWRNKKGQTDSTTDLSTFVTPSGDFSNHFLEDLKRLAKLTGLKSAQ